MQDIDSEIQRKINDGKDLKIHTCPQWSLSQERKTADGHHLRHDAQSFVYVAVGILKSGKMFDPAQ